MHVVDSQSFAVCCPLPNTKQTKTAKKYWFGSICEPAPSTTQDTNQNCYFNKGNAIIVCMPEISLHPGAVDKATLCHAALYDVSARLSFSTSQNIPFQHVSTDSTWERWAK